MNQPNHPAAHSKWVCLFHELTGAGLDQYVAEQFVRTAAYYEQRYKHTHLLFAMSYTLRSRVFNCGFAWIELSGLMHKCLLQWWHSLPAKNPNRYDELIED